MGKRFLLLLKKGSEFAYLFFEFRTPLRWLSNPHIFLLFNRYSHAVHSYFWHPVSMKAIQAITLESWDLKPKTWLAYIDDESRKYQFSFFSWCSCLWLTKCHRKTKYIYSNPCSTCFYIYLHVKERSYSLMYSTGFQLWNGYPHS